MGNSSSRTVSAVNTEPIHIIQIADTVIQRFEDEIRAASLKSNIPVIQETVEKTPPPAPVPVVESIPPLPLSAPVVESIPPPLPQNPLSSVRHDNQLHEEYILSAEEVIQATIRLRQEKEMALKELEDQWKNKLHLIEQKYVDMYKLSEDSCAEAIQDVEGIFASKQCLPICQEIQNDVMTCYENNKNNSLNCANLVKEFCKCVTVNRMEVLGKR